MVPFIVAIEISVKKGLFAKWLILSMFGFCESCGFFFQGDVLLYCNCFSLANMYDKFPFCFIFMIAEN